MKYILILISLFILLSSSCCEGTSTEGHSHNSKFKYELGDYATIKLTGQKALIVRQYSYSSPTYDVKFKASSGQIRTELHVKEFELEPCEKESEYESEYY